MCKSVQIRRVRTRLRAAAAAKKQVATREQWRWTVADDASHGSKTWLKWNENFFDEPARRTFKSQIKKRCKQKHWKSFNSMLSKQVGNCLACSAGSREEKWRQIEPNRSQIEANFPKSALACFNSRKINECRMKSRSAKSLIPNLHQPKPTDSVDFGNLSSLSVCICICIWICISKANRLYDFWKFDSSSVFSIQHPPTINGLWYSIWCSTVSGTVQSGTVQYLVQNLTPE